MSTLEQKYQALLREHVSLEVKYDLVIKRLETCEQKCLQLEKDVVDLKEMNKNQTAAIKELRQQVNDLMGLGKKKK